MTSRDILLLRLGEIFRQSDTVKNKLILVYFAATLKGKSAKFAENSHPCIIMIKKIPKNIAVNFRFSINIAASLVKSSLYKRSEINVRTDKSGSL